MPELTIAFSEQEVQEELERIAGEHVQRKQYDIAVAAYERLAAEYPESKWLGNILLLAALCYRELAQPERETEILQRFLVQCPNHPQTPAAQRALERVNVHYSEQVPTGDFAAVIEQLQGRVAAVSAALQQLQEKSSQVDQVAKSVDQLSKRIAAIEVAAPAGLLSDSPEGTEVSPNEMLGSVVQDLSAEAEALRQRVDNSLEALTREIAEFREQSGLTRFSWTFAGVAVLVSLLSLIFVVGSQEGFLFKRTQTAAQPTRALRAQAAYLAAERPGLERSLPGVTALKVAAPKTAARSANKNDLAVPSTQVKARSKSLSKTKSSVHPELPKAARLSEKRVTVYTVKSGDTLWEICKKQTGSASPKTLDKIAALNNLSPPYALRAGDSLRLPQ
jgi:nucleoid-associated protein YgaU